MFLLFDIGGTHIRACLSDGEKILRKEVQNTPQTFDETVSLFSQLKNELEVEEPIEQVVCGIAGVLHKEKHQLFMSPNLLEWRDKPLKKTLQDIFESNVVLENDAALAGLGEAVYGAATDENIVMYYTIGTGVGGVRIVNKKIDSKVFGFEPGRQIVNITNAFEKTGNKIEDFVGGNAITKATGKKPSDITDHNFWKNVEKNLAVGIYNSILHWSPDIVILGGGLIHTNLLAPDRIAQYVSELNTMYPEIPPFKKSKLQDESGLYGALAHAKAM